MGGAKLGDGLINDPLDTGLSHLACSSLAPEPASFNIQVDWFRTGHRQVLPRQTASI